MSYEGKRDRPAYLWTPKTWRDCQTNQPSHIAGLATAADPPENIHTYASYSQSDSVALFSLQERMDWHNVLHLEGALKSTPVWTEQEKCQKAAGSHPQSCAEPRICSQAQTQELEEKCSGTRVLRVLGKSQHIPLQSPLYIESYWKTKYINNLAVFVKTKESNFTFPSMWKMKKMTPNLAQRISDPRPAQPREGSLLQRLFAKGRVFKFISIREATFPPVEQIRISKAKWVFTLDLIIQTGL